MSAALYRLAQIGLAVDVRGNEMRRLIFSPLPCPAFGGKDNPHPEGTINHVVTVDEAADFEIGADYFLTFRREKGS